MANNPPPSDDLQHQEVVESYQRQGRWILPTFLAVALAVALAAIYSRPAYRWLKERRGEVLAREATEAMRSGNLETALLRIRTAVQIAPKSIEVARVTAEVCDLYGASEALGYWQTVITDAAATDGDRQKYVAAALRLGRGDLAQPELAKLLLKDERNLENLRLGILYLRQRGELDAAILAARRGVDLHPANVAPRLALASLLFEHPVATFRSEGRSLLWELATNGGSAQIEALVDLSQDRTLGQGDKERIVDLLGKIPALPFEPYLRLLNLRTELDPTSRPRWVGEIADRVARGTNSLEISSALAWLNQNQASDSLLKVMPLARARKDPVWLFWHLSALGAVGNWDELVRLLDDATLTVAPQRKFGLLAAASHAQGNPEAARNHLDSAIGAARGQVDEIRRLARLSEEIGDHDMAMRAWSELLDLPSLARGAAQQILRLSQSGDRSDLVVLAGRRLLNLSPDDLLALNELGYVLFLEGRRDPAVEQHLIAAVQRPDSPHGLRITYALLLLQDNRAADALDQLEAHGLDWEKAPARWRFIHAVVLAANQQRESAKRILGGIDQARLKTAERNLASKWF